MYVIKDFIDSSLKNYTKTKLCQSLWKTGLGLSKDVGLIPLIKCQSILMNLYVQIITQFKSGKGTHTKNGNDMVILGRNSLDYTFK